jgi:hypothetical protein
MDEHLLLGERQHKEEGGVVRSQGSQQQPDISESLGGIRL